MSEISAYLSLLHLLDTSRSQLRFYNFNWLWLFVNSYKLNWFEFCDAIIKLGATVLFRTHAIHHNITMKYEISRCHLRRKNTTTLYTSPRHVTWKRRKSIYLCKSTSIIRMFVLHHVPKILFCNMQTMQFNSSTPWTREERGTRLPFLFHWNRGFR